MSSSEEKIEKIKLSNKIYHQNYEFKSGFNKKYNFL